VVRGVIAASTSSSSRLQVSGRISTNTGLIPFQSSACVVAAKVYGVVMTSPVIRNACNAVISASVPLAKRHTWGTPRYCPECFLELLVKGSAVGEPPAFPDLGEIGKEVFEWRQVRAGQEGPVSVSSEPGGWQSSRFYHIIPAVERLRALFSFSRAHLTGVRDGSSPDTSRFAGRDLGEWSIRQNDCPGGTGRLR
jgi:hypothetical protein